LVGFELRTSWFVVKLKSTFFEAFDTTLLAFQQNWLTKIHTVIPTSWKSSVRVPITYKLVYREGWLHPVFQLSLYHHMGLQRSLRCPVLKIPGAKIPAQNFHVKCWWKTSSQLDPCHTWNFYIQFFDTQLLLLYKFCWIFFVQIWFCLC